MNKKITSIISIILATFLIATVSNANIMSHKENISTLGLGSTITSETTISYPVNDQGTLLNFGHERTYGAGFRFRWTIPFEGYYGIKVKTDGAKATCKHYTHNKTATIKNLTIKDENMKVVKTLATPNTDSTCTIDFAGLKDSKLYFISETWFVEDVGKDNEIDAPVYFKDNTVYTCMRQSAYSGDGAENKKRWEKLFADADPEDYLSLKEITYPTSGCYGHVTQVEEWQKKAHELLENHDSWSDEMKVFAFVEHLATNYAYDDYRLYTLKCAYRADEFPNDDGYKMDSNYMYWTHTGVCWDFTNVLTIMCREYGIPCTSADNDHHTIAAVWLNDQWVPIDVTLLLSNTCPTKDTSKSNWVPNNDIQTYAYGGYPESTFLTHDQQIWTKKTALGE